MIRLDFHPDIYQEVRDGYLWYESKSRGLGEDFIIELEYAFSSITEMPKTWPVISKDLRRYFLKRFPYGVIYNINKDKVFVVAVMHLSREPGYWLKRLKD